MAEAPEGVTATLRLRAGARAARGSGERVNVRTRVVTSVTTAAPARMSLVRRSVFTLLCVERASALGSPTYCLSSSALDCESAATPAAAAPIARTPAPAIPTYESVVKRDGFSDG